MSKKTRQKVSVALSGDGGDELFAGYNKHRAEFNAQKRLIINYFIKAALPAFKLLPASRNSKATNLFRQIQRYSEGLQLSRSGRYWKWCTLTTEQTALSLLKNKLGIDNRVLESEKQRIMDLIPADGDLNDILYADMNMVLPNDMLVKVDMMSMANSLEVRVPLLDYTVVNYAFGLPVEYKIGDGKSKKILKEAFEDVLPPEILNRPKHGFEVPLLKWLQTGLRTLIENELLEKNFIEGQGIFEWREIEKLRAKLFSKNPGDVHALIWSLLVFQYWFKKYFTANA